MRRRLIFYLLVSFFFFLFSPGVIRADGVILPIHDSWVRPTRQEAVIFFDQGRETMVIRYAYEGATDKFAWIIPVPSRPEVSRGRLDLFENLRQLTAPLYRIQPLEFERDRVSGKQETGAVQVWEEKVIDIFKIAVLSSDQPRALEKWLQSNGYYYPRQLSYLFQEYIDQNWFFVAAKIEQKSSSAKEDLRRGQAAPLKISFATPQPFYPFRLTAAGLKERSRSKGIFPVTFSERDHRRYPPQNNGYLQLTLYVFSQEKVRLPNFATTYAGWLLPKTINNLSRTPTGEAWVEAKRKMYLTRLSRNLSLNQLPNEDFVFLPAPNNRAVGRGHNWVWNWKEKVFFVFLLPAIFLALIFIFVRREIKSWVNPPQEGEKSNPDSKILATEAAAPDEFSNTQ